MAKRKFRFNFVDVLAIILVIAIGVGVYFAVSSGFFTGGSKNDVTLRCVIRTSDIDSELAVMLKSGSTLYMPDGKSKVGTVSAVEVRPAIYSGVADGGVVNSEIEGMSCLYITVEIDAVYDGTSYKLDGTVISVGSRLDFISPELAAAGEFIAIEKIN